MKRLDSIFIQPTYDCALNCTGCYVKGSKKHEEMDTKVWGEFFDYLWTTDRYVPGHVTLALDDIPHSNDKIMPKGTRAAKFSAAVKMRAITAMVHGWRLLSDKIEFHFTANSLSTLSGYGVGVNVPWIDSLVKVDIASFSHLSRVDARFLQNVTHNTSTQINYNFMPGSTTLDTFIEVLEHVDMSYVILYKSGLGRRQDPGAIYNYKKALEFLDKRLDHEQKKKIIVDACVTDSYNFLTEGRGCRANIGKIHIWPDGHVSGCPYNMDGGRPATNLTELIQNINKALDTYEFPRCTIPKAYYLVEPATTSSAKRGNLTVID